MAMMQEQFGEAAIARPGRQYVLDADYFRRIDAMHFVLAHDDGQAQAGIDEADVVLVGVSRSSKTPTSFYLANRGIKAANIPLVPGLTEPPGLEKPACPVIGLTLDAEALIEIRRHRLRMLGAAKTAAAARQDSGDYVDPESVQGGIALDAPALCAKRLAGDRRHPPLHRGDGGNGAAVDGSLARSPAQSRHPGATSASARGRATSFA